jgi:pteridine reductase
MDLKNRVILLTGASGFLAETLAPEVARAGAVLALHYHQHEHAASSIQRQIIAAGGAARIYRADLSKATEAETLAERVIADFHRLDVIIHAAGNFREAPFGQIREDDWEQAFAVHVKGFFFLAQKAAPALRAAGGKILIFADIAAYRPYLSSLPYSAAKAALLSLNKSLARTLAPEVTVNAIAPGILMRPEAAMKLDDKLRQRIPLQRFGTAEEVARAVLFLLQDADYATASVLRMDGGRLLNDSFDASL